MDMSSIADAALGLLVAAKTGAIEAATSGAAKLGGEAVKKFYSLVKGKFVKDGEGATRKFEEFETNPKDETKQSNVKNRLVEFLEDDPQFFADVKAIVGEVKIDNSVHISSAAGANSTITTIVGSNNVKVSK